MFRFAVFFLAIASVSWVQLAMATNWPNPEESCPAVKQELADILGAWKLANECRPNLQALQKCCSSKVRLHELLKKCSSADGPLILDGHVLCDVKYKSVFPLCNLSPEQKAFKWKREAKEALPLAVIFAAICKK